MIFEALLGLPRASQRWTSRQPGFLSLQHRVDPLLDPKFFDPVAPVREPAASPSQCARCV